VCLVRGIDLIIKYYLNKLPFPVAAPSEKWVCGRWPAEIAVSNPAGGMDICLLWVSCVVR